MKPHEAEKLLGGYATGILTEAEKTVLFRAALEHQELFDALANEEALRELLADPATRSHLLTLLDEPRILRPIPFWRRPATLGFAASLFVMVTTSLVLWQREHPVPPVPATPAAKIEAEAPSPAPAVHGAPSQGEKARPMASDFRAIQGGKSLPAEPPQAAALNAGPMLKAAPAPPQAGAVVEVVASAAAPDKSEVTTGIADAKESLERLPAPRALAERMALAPGVAGGGLGAKGLAVSTPTWTMEPLEGGNLRWTITWATGEHLYLLRRTASGTQLLAPLASIPGPNRTTRSTFETPLDVKDHLDLYVLHHPEADPKGLPPTGAVDGFRQRLQ